MEGPIHPLASGLAGTGYAAERATAERAKSTRRVESKLTRGTAEDFFDRQIETADAIEAIHEDQSHRETPNKKRDKKKPADDQDRPSLDITG